MDIWSHFIIRARWIFALLWVLLTAGAVQLLPDLDFRFNLGQMLRGDEARLTEIRQFYGPFPPFDGHLMVAASSPETLTINDLRAAGRWADEYRALPEVKEVISIGLLLDRGLERFARYQRDRPGQGGDETLDLDEIPGMATFRGSLLSRDGKSVALYLIRENGFSWAQFQEAVESVEARPWNNAEIRMVGPQYLLKQMEPLLKSNFHKIFLYEFLALLFVTPLVLRSLRRAYLPFVVALSALAFYLALFVLAGQRFGVMNLAGPGLILVIGLADAIHLQQKFDDARAEGHNVAGALRIMFGSVGHACALTSLTTACGFLSLLAARHDEIYQFGVWCAIGVVTVFVTVIVFLPVALVFFPGTGARTRIRSVIRPRILRRLVVPVTVVFVVLIAGIYRTRLDSSLDRELPESVEVVRNANWFGEHFRGLDRIEVDLHANLKDPKVFGLVNRMQNDLRDFPGISGSQSYVDAVRVALLPEEIDIDDGPMFGLAILISKGAFPKHLLTRDLSRACLVFYRTSEFGTEGYEAFRSRVCDYARELPDGASMKLNGQFPMFYDSTIQISETMIRSLACSVTMITAILIIVFRSVKLGLLCLVPNAVPLLVVAGFIGWMGESLHLGILVVFSVGIGLAVDDTIHLLVRFRQLQKEKPSASHRELMDEAVVSTGVAIVLTSVVLLISAMCFLGSDFTTMRWIGVTLGIVAVTALLADLILLPWLIEKFHRRPACSPSDPA